MRTAGRLCGSLLGFLLLQTLVFNTTFYASILNPESSAGFLELRLGNELRRAVTDRNQILAIGDSRMGFFPRYANELNPSVGYTFASISAAGTTPRSWYYMLRDAQPRTGRYAAIVIPMPDYDDAETWDNHAEYITDLHYLIARLRWTDVWEFSRSYESAANRWRAARGILLKGLVYKVDFQDFLLHPAARLAYADQSRRESSGWYYDYVGSDRNLRGASIDWIAREVHTPPTVSPAEKEKLEGFLAPPPPEKGRRSVYLKFWLNKIYELYRGSGTRIIFIRLPRGPFVRPDQPLFNPHSSVRELAAHNGVILSPEHFFDVLERPELFMDYAHLNAAGCAQFSRMLARHVRELLGPANAL